MKGLVSNFWALLQPNGVEMKILCTSIALAALASVDVVRADEQMGVIGSQQFLDGVSAASKATDGGVGSGGFSQGWWSSSTVQCDEKAQLSQLENLSAKGTRLILFQPCKWQLGQDSTLKKFTDAGTKIVLLRPIEGEDGTDNFVPTNNQAYKGILMQYYNSSSDLTIHDVQDYGVGYTIGMAAKSYKFDGDGFGAVDQALKNGSYAATSTIFDPDGILVVDGWSAKENCDPCPRGDAAACPQKIVEQKKECCGKTSACPQ